MNTQFEPNYESNWASLVAQLVKNLPVMQETQVQSLGQEDPLEKEMAHYSSILAWRLPWTETPGRLQSMGSDTTEQLSHYMSLNLALLIIKVQKKWDRFTVEVMQIFLDVQVNVIWMFPSISWTYINMEK